MNDIIMYMIDCGKVWIIMLLLEDIIFENFVVVFMLIVVDVVFWIFVVELDNLKIVRKDK